MLSQLEAELESQRIELTAEFDDAFKKRDREMREREDEINVDALAHQLKVSLISVSFYHAWKLYIL